MRAGTTRLAGAALALVLAGCESGAPTGGPAFEIVTAGSTHVATSSANASLRVEIDCDDETLDGRFFGITPVLGDRRLELSMWGSRYGFVTPDFDAGAIRCVAIESDETALSVRFEAGSYATLVAGAPDQPVPLVADFRVEADGRLAARLSGLFYLFPTAQSTSLRIASATTTATRVVTRASPASTETFDDVTSVLVQDALFGEIAIDGAVRRLQMQIWDLTTDEGFELDMDHAFKDFGQTSVDAAIGFR